MQLYEIPGDNARKGPTPPEIFLNRRRFMQFTCASGVLMAGGTLPACALQDSQSNSDGGSPDPRIVPPNQWPDGFELKRREGVVPLPDLVREHRTPRLTAAKHNNFYEFLPGSGGDVWPLTDKFDVSTWSLEISGECENPQTLSLDDLFRIEHEERLYHFRCVERWAMNVPWAGFPLNALLKRVKPTNNATHVRFVTANRPEQMPGVRSAGHYPWPYFEGLRLDEAMHDLTFVATGVYGEPLPKQHGAPVRMVVPWKYGYKGGKSIVKIELVTDEPQTLWRQMQPHEYGFISNVNPNIPHPRWSQQQSYWLGSQERFPTAIFNGYEKYVADMYPDEPREMQEALRPGQLAR